MLKQIQALFPSKVKTGRGGTIPLAILLAIWSLSAISSLPGLAVSPILGKLQANFPHSTSLDIQMLTSLPSLLIIPFVLLSGKLSTQKDKIKLLYWGLGIFLLSGVLYLFAKSMVMLILISCLLGAGAGLVIPLSTGLIADYFTGNQRAKQLGISSAVNNMTLVLATFIAGYLADFSWHAPFIVYLLPIVSILLVANLRKIPPIIEVKNSNIDIKKVDKAKVLSLMGLYFTSTYLVLVIAYNLPFLMQHRHIDSSISGTLISVFFLAIMAPGFFINTIIRKLKHNTVFITILMICIGIFIMALFKEQSLIGVGCIITGIGYGILQPLIYEKAASIAISNTATLILAFVMATNYLAILLYPFIIKLFTSIFTTSNGDLPFIINATLAAAFAALAYFRRGSFTFK